MSSAPLVALLENDLHGLLKKYADSGLTVAETIGAFEIVKMEAYMAAKEDDDAAEEG